MPYSGPLYYRDVEPERGEGQPPIVVLHGGWGYQIYPFDDAIAGIPRRFVIPDRTGYGKSPPLAEIAPRFHQRYAAETAELLAALGIRRYVLWGHSDGAIVAANLAARDPSGCAGLILEAIHLERVKPSSRAFFTQMANDPDGFGERVSAVLAAEHGENWRAILRAGGRAWLHIAATPDDDYFDRRLHEIVAPTLVLHGEADPRTEPGELDRLRREVPHAQIHLLAGGKHSPHSERATAATCTELAAKFVAAL